MVLRANWILPPGMLTVQRFLGNEIRVCSISPNQPQFPSLLRMIVLPSHFFYNYFLREKFFFEIPSLSLSLESDSFALWLGTGHLMAKNPTAERAFRVIPPTNTLCFFLCLPICWNDQYVFFEKDQFFFFNLSLCQQLLSNLIALSVFCSIRFAENRKIVGGEEEGLAVRKSMRNNPRTAGRSPGFGVSASVLRAT